LPPAGVYCTHHATWEMSTKNSVHLFNIYW
jgi:hypothetical protein